MGDRQDAEVDGIEAELRRDEARRAIVGCLLLSALCAGVVWGFWIFRETPTVQRWCSEVLFAVVVLSLRWLLGIFGISVEMNSEADATPGGDDVDDSDVGDGGDD